MAANPGVYTGMELRAIVASGTRTSFPFGRIPRLHRGPGAFPRGLRFQLLPLFLLLAPERLIFLLHLLDASSAASRASCRLRGPTWLLPLKGTGLQRPARWRSAVLGPERCTTVAASASRDSHVLAPGVPPRPRLRTPRPPPWAGSLDVLCKCSRPKRGLSGWLLSSARFQRPCALWPGSALLPAAEAEPVVEARALRRLMAGGTVSTVWALYVIQTLRPWAPARTHWLESLFSVLSGCTPTSDLAGSRGNSVCDLLGT